MNIFRLSILLSVLTLVSCQKQDALPDDPVAVSVMEARKQAITQNLTATGEIAARTQSDLSFRLSGRISERFVDVGTHVLKGQILARIDPEEQRAAVTSARAGVDSAQSQLRQATLTLERQKTLFAQANTARSAVDRAEEAFHVAHSELESARASLETSQEQLAQTELRANANGTITAVSGEVGQVVQPAQSIVTLAEDDGRDAVFNVSERRLLDVALAEGADIHVRLLSSPASETVGKVREISPTVDSASGTVRIKVGLEKIPAGMTLGATVIVSAGAVSHGQIAVPWQALTTDHGRQALWIVDRDTKKVSIRPVTVTRYLNDSVVIGAGLSTGDLIVAKGAQLLHPQQLVTWENEG